MKQITSLNNLALRDVQPEDLPTLFEHQWDPPANRMAAFPAREHEAFMQHWTTNILGNTQAINKVIVQDGVVVGNLGVFAQGGETLIGYWIGRKYWGRGIASWAVRALLSEVPIRPLRAHVAKHNVASIRVLEKCGFVRGPEQPQVEFAGELIHELLLELRG